MFNVPPIQDSKRNIRLRQLEGITEIQPIAPYPRIEETGHASDETGRPAAVEERLRRGRHQGTGGQSGGTTGEDGHQVDEYV